MRYTQKGLDPAPPSCVLNTFCLVHFRLGVSVVIPKYRRLGRAHLPRYKGIGIEEAWIQRLSEAWVWAVAPSKERVKLFPRPRHLHLLRNHHDPSSCAIQFSKGAPGSYSSPDGFSVGAQPRRLLNARPSPAQCASGSLVPPQGSPPHFIFSSFPLISPSTD